MVSPKQLPQALLHELFYYDAESGELYWRERPVANFKTDRDCNAWNSLYANKIAGCISKLTGYRYIRYDGKRYEAHRLVWCYVTGEWPDNIDHERGVRHDNRFERLCNGTHQDNHKNQALSKNNTSGVCGVYFRTTDSRWVAFITISRRKLYLGRFLTKEDAVERRKQAETEYGFHPNHGRKRA